MNCEGFDLGKTFGLLACIDFDRALGLVQSLNNKPLRLASLVTVAGTVLDKTAREKRAAR